MPDHGYTISSPCEPEGSGELNRHKNTPASTNNYKFSFFPQTIRDWNDLPNSLVSTAELLDDCISKFTSRVRAKD